MVKQLWQSYRRQPLMTQVWCACWVFPLNLATLAVLGWGPYCHQIMGFALLGAFGCLAVSLAKRGVTKLGGLPKLIFWTPMVFLIMMVLLRYELSAAYASFLVLLAVTNVIQLTLSYQDWLDWWRGDRGVV